MIAAILFYQAEPMTVKRLAALLKRTEGEVRDGLRDLEQKLEVTGLRLLQNGDEVTLGTAPEASALIEAITKEELSKDLSKAALETIAIVLYKGPITRAEIDYIRGVNSTFILRNLLVRGLVEKVDNPQDQRSFLYKATFQLLEYMGVSKIEELPDYHDTIAQLGAFAAQKETEKAEAAASEATVTERSSTDPGTDTTSSEEGSASAFESDENSASMVAEMIEDELDQLDEEADIDEEDEVGPGFLDEELQDHTEHDRTESA